MFNFWPLILSRLYHDSVSLGCPTICPLQGKRKSTKIQLLGPEAACWGEGIHDQFQ